MISQSFLRWVIYGFILMSLVSNYYPVSAKLSDGTGVFTPSGGEQIIMPVEKPSQLLEERSGFTIAIIVFIGMLVSIAYVGFVMVKTIWQDAEGSALPPPETSWRAYTVPILAFLGLIVAGYLAYVETQTATAVCGPVGDCNAVQASPYARLFGVLPIGILGVLGYVLIIVAWLIGTYSSGKLSTYSSLIIFGLAFFGTLFSLYLTFLEPFVIKAVCMWCISSAIIITLIFLMNAAPVLRFILEDEDDS